MDLLGQIKNTLQKNKVELLADIAHQNARAIKELIQLSFHEDEQIGFRAAWILENIYSSYPDHFSSHLSEFLSCYAEQNNLSAKRHFAKIMAFATNNKADDKIKMQIQQIDLTPIIETTFDWLLNEKTPVAIKSHCLNILANLVPRHEWIKEELIQTMDYLVDKESIAFFAKVKQIRKQLRKY